MRRNANGEADDRQAAAPGAAELRTRHPLRFDTARVQRMIEIVTPIFTAQRQPPKDGLKPEDIATNEFVDTSIGVPG